MELVALSLVDHAGERAHGLGGPVEGEVENRTVGTFNAHTEHALAKSDQAEHELLGDRRLSDAVGADQHEAFTRRPRDRAGRSTPDGHDVTGRVEDELVTS